MTLASTVALQRLDGLRVQKCSAESNNSSSLLIQNNNNRPNVRIKNHRCIPIDVAIPADRNVTQNEAEKKLIQQLKYRDTGSVEHEMCDYIGGIWSHRNSN
jgi:hypothetical protein